MAINDSRLTLKDHIRETQLFSNRVIVGLILAILLISALIARMIYLQVVSHEHFTTLSQNNRVSLQPLAPTRGLIFDRNGVLMAQNLPSFSLEIVPEKIADMDETLKRLSEIIQLEERDLERFAKLRRQSSKFRAVPLRFRLSEEEVARFTVRRHNFPGVDIAARLMRHYPQGNLAVHAIGYVGRINEKEWDSLDQSNYNGTTHIGKNGVERFYESDLHGTVGFKRVETNAQGRVLRVLEKQSPVPGKNLFLHLDSKVQAAAEKALGEDRGAVVAIDTRTGGILAMASMPGFDPNPFVNGIDSEAYTKLARSNRQPLFNRAIKGRYPPGSTVKPFIGLAGLEHNIVHPGTHIDCPGWYSLKNDDHRYRDWKKTGHGATTLRGAIRESCDVYYYDLALNLGIDRLHSFVTKFGFGSYTDVDIHGEVRGLIPSREWKRRRKGEIWYPGETLITGIGQGFTLASPLQIASATAALANYGLILQPRLAMAWQEPGVQDKEYTALAVKGSVPIVKKEHWDHVIDSMISVVHSPRGTAVNISDARYRIAGKTGTAQVFGIKQDEEYVKEDIEAHLRDHALFVSFAPARNPKIAVAVIVENGGSGGGVAAPIARKVMDAFLIGGRS